MGAARQAMSTHDSTTEEYTIYTFQRSGEENRKPERWQKQKTFTILPEAVKTAESMYESGEYHRIEIKRKHIDHKNGQPIGSTLKIFEERRRKKIIASLATWAVAILGGIAFTVTYYLGQE